jgi:DNA polymerase-3 subunit beta
MEGHVMLTANNPDQENASEDVKVAYDGPSMDIGFNARYLEDIGGQVGADDVQMFVKDSASPVLVRDPADATTLFVVMPMRV